jgi:unsaturated rhamnogalacturonyl hydrolase
MPAGITSPYRFATIASVMVLLLLAPVFSGAAEPQQKPVLLYSRYFNAKGEDRYAAETTYRDVLAKLRETFDVRVNDEPLNAQTLKGVAVVLIANPSDKAAPNNPPPHHVSADDVRNLTAFVNAGGGLITMANQENHNLDTDDFNQLLRAFGMHYENRYTDAKRLVISKDVPLIGGLAWAYYTGNQIVVEPNHPAKARPLVENDLAQKPESGPRDEKGTLLAVAEPGKGHVVVVTDCGWLINDALSGKGIGGVAIKEHDNFEILQRLVKWSASGAK